LICQPIRSDNSHHQFTIVFVYIICICNILSLLVFICTGEDFIGLQLMSYPFVLFCMTMKYV
jgi:hypothetical protein